MTLLIPSLDICSQMGIGTVKDIPEARAWYRAAAEHGDKRANQRLTALGGQPVPLANEVEEQESKRKSKADIARPLSTGPQSNGRMPPHLQSGHGPAPGPNNGQAIRPVAMSAREQGQRIAHEHAQRMLVQSENNRLQQQHGTNGSLTSPVGTTPDFLSMRPAFDSTNNNSASPVKDAQTAQREHAFQMAIQQQHAQRIRGSPAQSSMSGSPRIPYGAESAYLQQSPSQQQPQFFPRPPPQQYQRDMLPRPQPPRQGSPRIRQGSTPPITQEPGNSPYPSYPNQSTLAQGNGAAPAIGSPLSAEPSEKKKSLWTQLKQI
jgi:hypothetical protein